MPLLERTCNTERMNMERLAARIFVGLGGIIWIAAALGASTRYLDESLGDAAMSALLPLAITIGALAVGWFYEKLVALLLGIGVVAVAAWGIIAGWEIGVWALMGAVLMAPMLIAALLFMLAARMQNICTLEEAQA